VLSLAGKHGCSPAQVILRWGLQKGHIILPKSSNPARVAENAALFGFTLDEGDMAALAANAEAKKMRMVNPPYGGGGRPLFPDAPLDRLPR
jgi:2,5-diketo-D-gluconate reductase A